MHNSLHSNKQRKENDDSRTYPSNRSVHYSANLCSYWRSCIHVGYEMTLPNVHSKAMSLQQALEFSKTLAKHNPFVRMQPEEQELANQAGTLLGRMANTEELEFLLRDERWNALF